MIRHRRIEDSAMQRNESVPAGVTLSEAVFQA